MDSFEGEFWKDEYDKLRAGFWKRIKELEVTCQEKEGFIVKLNGECTELHQRIMTQGRASAVRIDELTKRLYDKNDSMTKLQGRVDMFVNNCDAMQKASRSWYEKYKDAEEWRDYWKKEYFELYAELQNQAKALSEANEKLNKLAEAEGTEPWNWRARYWEVVGKLAARRDECQDLVKENEELRAELETKTVRSVQNILVKNAEISKTEQVIEDLVDERRKLREDLGVKKDRIAFLEELVGSLYGEGWSKLTIADAQDYRDVKAMGFKNLKKMVAVMDGAYDCLSKKFNEVNVELAVCKEKNQASQ